MKPMTSSYFCYLKLRLIQLSFFFLEIEIYYRSLCFKKIKPETAVQSLTSPVWFSLSLNSLEEDWTLKHYQGEREASGADGTEFRMLLDSRKGCDHG